MSGKKLRTKLSERFSSIRKAHMEQHQIEIELRKKMYEKHRSYHEEIEKIKMEFRQKAKTSNKKQDDLHWVHRNNRLSRIFIVVFNILIWFLIFRFFGAKVLTVGIASFMTLGGILQFIYSLRLEKNIFKPIERLKKGVEEISKGNYDVEIECDIFNEIGILIDSFNDMAKKLNESERIKQEYEENRKNLIANISHDLKTPITSIQGYIETMLERPDVPQETVNKYHQIIYNNAAYMNRLIDDLFLFSKLDLQKLELELEDISLKAFMEDIMEEFKYELEDRDIKFIYNAVLEHDCKITIDRKRINQVFRNIIGNAIKYGNDQNVEISVRLHAENGFACIDITDNGPGIPAEKLPHIFDRFYRIDTQRTKDLMSTGLGLAISKELVEAHKGTISVSSIESIGSTFTVKIPIEKGESL
ncbi:MAG TPA: HAMP domain-containing sensor histidine kinase [Ruminiclostridium sp.]|nr:HAMP domain-containing sensor histidine kinase [Ruminiclostridium sp.]